MGVNNLKWDDAMASMDRYFPDEKLTGWSESFTTKQIAALQRPHKWIGTEPTKLCIALFKKLNNECRIGAIPATKQEIPTAAMTPLFAEINPSTLTAKQAYLLGEAKGKKLVEEIVSFIKPTPTVEGYLVTAKDFKNWLKLQGEVPSVHIRAWFDAVIPAVQTVPNVPATTAPAVKQVQRRAAHDAAILATLQTMGVETKEARQKRRYDLCIAAGLQMPSDDYSHLPTGIGALARAENISTAAFSKDVKAYIASKR